MSIKKRLFLLVLALGAVVGAKGQDVAIKTNVLADIALSPNVGVEVGLAPRWSVDITGEYNQWTVQEHKWKHWLVQPEARYWFCDRFAKHFVGAHLMGGQYNVGNIGNNINFLGSNFSQLTNNFYEGWGIGAGIAYGYALPLWQHWNLEFEIGIGYVYTRFDKFECTECRRRTGSGDHHYFGPTKAAINLVYLF